MVYLELIRKLGNPAPFRLEAITREDEPAEGRLSRAAQIARKRQLSRKLGGLCVMVAGLGVVIFHTLNKILKSKYLDL